MIHVTAAADHKNLPVMMAGFLVVATLQVAFGGLALLRRPGRLLLAAGLALFAGSLGMWLLSRTSGIPYLPGGHMEPIGFKDGVTKVFELGAVASALLLMSRDLPGITLPTARLGRHALAGLGAGMFLLSVPALMLGGGEHHSADQHAAMSGHAQGEEGHPHDGELLAEADEGHEHGGARKASKKHAHAGGGGHDTTEHSDGHAMLPASEHLHEGAPHSGAGGPSDTHGHSKPGAGEHPHGGSGAEEDGGHGHGGAAAGEGDGHGHGGDAEQPDGLAFEAGRPGEGGAPGRGSALVWRTQPSSSEGAGHHGDGSPCNPSADQQAAADRLASDTKAALVKYENNPARALADGFYYAFGPTDRIMHMVSPARLDDPTILDPAEIESFLYAMTDEGWMPIGGMYILPEHGMEGPQIGGCRTQWHYHGGVGGRIASAGTMEETPPMLHVWTYPGLDPYGHYDGRDLSQLWTPGSVVPSFCRQAGDSSDVCFP